MKVIFDTNTLLMPMERKVDVLAQVEELIEDRIAPSIVQPTIGELKSLASKRDARGRAASVGLKYLEKNNFKVIPTTSAKADAAILEAVTSAGRGEFVVCTEDKFLRKKVKAAGARAISWHEGRMQLA